MKFILTIIFIRTIFELEIEYHDNGSVKSFGRLTPTMWTLYSRLNSIEATLYRNNKKLYLDANCKAKEIWSGLKAGHEDFEIEIEPLVCGLYFSDVSTFKQYKLLPTLASRIYDSYFNSTNCRLEVQCRELVDEMLDKADKAVFDYRKDMKRNADTN